MYFSCTTWIICLRFFLNVGLEIVKKLASFVGWQAEWVKPKFLLPPKICLMNVDITPAPKRARFGSAFYLQERTIHFPSLKSFRRRIVSFFMPNAAYGCKILKI